MLKFLSFVYMALFIFITSGFSQSNSNQDQLLYSQINLPNNYTSIYTDTEYPIADNFTVTSDWIIEKVVVVGTDVSTNMAFGIYFYTNNNNLPDSIVYSAIVVPSTISMLTWDIYEVTIDLEIPALLNAGDYFLSVTSFWWNQIASTYGGAALKYNGTTWNPVGPNVLTDYSDMYFELYGNSVTPVELTSFSANVNDDNIELRWITSTETNNQGFEVQRSNEGEFETTSFVEGHGTTTESQAYSFTDKNVVTGKYKYRLKQIDYDGKFEYSNVIEVKVTSPLTFSLEQNYPNPFNPSTMISYKLPVSSDVTIKVYDVLGNEVATLVNEEKPAGKYEVDFSAEGLSSGIYLYKLQTGDFVETRKMILVK